jgi:hypothetical protein
LATEYSVAIGDVCAECKAHTEAAGGELCITPGMTPEPQRLPGDLSFVSHHHENRPAKQDRFVVSASPVGRLSGDAARVLVFSENAHSEQPVARGLLSMEISAPWAFVSSIKDPKEFSRLVDHIAPDGGSDGQ